MSNDPPADADVRITPEQQLVQDTIFPHLRAASLAAEQHGIPLLCVVQTRGLLPQVVDLATIGANASRFCHPAATRFLTDFFATAQGDPADSDWGPGERALVDALIYLARMWAASPAENQRHLALTSTLVLQVGLSALDPVLKGRARNALYAVLGWENASRFEHALAGLQRDAERAPIQLEVPDGPIPTLRPGRN